MTQEEEEEVIKLTAIYLKIRVTQWVKTYDTTIKKVRKPNHLGNSRQNKSLISTLSFAEAGTQLLSVGHTTGVTPCVNCRHYFE